MLGGGTLIQRGDDRVAALQEGWPKRLVRNLPAESVLLPFLLFVVVPLYVARNSGLGILQIPAQVWIVLGAAAAAGSLILVIAQLFASAFGVGANFSMLVRLATLFGIVAGLVWPVSVARGAESVNTARLSPAGLVMSSVVALALFALTEIKGAPHTRMAVGVFVVGNVLVLVFGGDAGAATAIDDIAVVSPTMNLVVVSFDDLNGAAVVEVLNERPELADSLRGFVVFERAASSSPATSASIGAELYGNRPFKSVAATAGDLWQLDPDLLMTNALADDGFHVATYGTYSTARDDNVRYSLPARAWGGTAEQLVQLGLTRILGPSIAARAEIPMGVEHWLNRTAHVEPEDESLVASIGRSHTPDWDRDLTMTTLDFERFVNGLQVKGDEPSALFFHFTFTHYPVEWDRHCMFRGHDVDWYESHQSYMGALEEAECVLRKIEEVVNRMEGLGVLDQTLVVFKSDHGKPLGYVQAGSIEGSAINEHALWGVSRYAPFLAVKDLGADVAKPVKFDSSPVMIDDLARTICERLAVLDDCSVYPGFDLLNLDKAQLARSEVNFFVVESKESTFRYRDHVAVRFERGDDILESFVGELKDLGMTDR